jgi:hypothetical protein
MTEIKPQTRRVFISYSSIDKPFVDRLANDLLKAGIDIWIDTLEILAGDSLVEKIFDQGIANSDYLLIVLSESATKSNWVKKELSIVFIRELQEKRVVVIPVLTSDCIIPMSIQDKKYADFRQDYSKGLIEVLKAIPPSTGNLYQPTCVVSDPCISSTQSNDAILAYNRARLYYTNGDLLKAMELFLLAIQIDPTLVDAHYNLGVIGYDLALKKEESPEVDILMKNVIDRYEFVLKLREDDIDTMVNLAAAYRTCTKFENPQREYELLKRAVALAPNYALVYLNLAHFFAKYGGWKEFRDNLDDINNKGSASVTFNINYLQQAIIFYKKAAKLDKNLKETCKTMSEGVQNLINLCKKSNLI